MNDDRIQPIPALSVVGIPVAPTDRLVLTTLCNFANVVLEARGQIMQPNGTIVPYTFQHRVGGSPITVTTSEPLHYGMLFSVTLRVVSGDLQRGMCFSRVEVRSFGSAEGDSTHLLLSDYSRNDELLSWPPGTFRSMRSKPGALRTLLPAQPAAGTNWSVVPAAETTWRVYLVRFTLICSATVATRQVRLQLRGTGTNLLVRLPASITQLAGSTVTYNYARVGFAVGLSIGVDVVEGLSDIWLREDYSLESDVLNLQAGDLLTAITLLVEEWIDTLP